MLRWPVCCAITRSGTSAAAALVASPARDERDALQSDRLKFAAGLLEIKTLVNELLSFQVKITEAGLDTYGAWREGAHDDLVFAVALAAWYAERFGRPEVARPITFAG